MPVDTTMPVLIVTSDETLAQMLSKYLRQIGFSHIDAIGDGIKAFELAKRRTYGLIFGDWNMVPLSGLGLLKAIRRQPGLQKTPFIMVAEAAKAENVTAAKAAGVNSYIVKPFTAATLGTKIAAGLGAR